MNEATAQTTTLKRIFASGSFAKNWAYLFTSYLFSQALGMISLIRVARVLAPAGYGFFNIVDYLSVRMAAIGSVNMKIR